MQRQHHESREDAYAAGMCLDGRLSASPWSERSVSLGRNVASTPCLSSVREPRAGCVTSWGILIARYRYPERATCFLVNLLPAPFSCAATRPFLDRNGRNAWCDPGWRLVTDAGIGGTVVGRGFCCGNSVESGCAGVE
jgi:hypothetical protein